jgi:hypothetical protein
MFLKFELRLETRTIFEYVYLSYEEYKHFFILWTFSNLRTFAEHFSKLVNIFLKVRTFFHKDEQFSNMRTIS